MNLRLAIEYDPHTVARGPPFRISWTPVTSRGTRYAEYDVTVENLTTGQLFLDMRHIRGDGTGARVYTSLEEPPNAGTYKASLYGSDGGDDHTLLMTTSITYDATGEDPAPARSAAYYRPISTGSSPRGRGEHIIRRSSRLHEVDRKYCSCLVAVAQKQTPECLVTRSWGGAAVPWEDGAPTPSSGRCYNPYAICQTNRRRALGLEAGDVSPRAPSCFSDYDLRRMNDGELLALALLHGHAYPDSWGVYRPDKMSPEDRNRLVREMSLKQEERRSRSPDERR